MVQYIALAFYHLRFAGANADCSLGADNLPCDTGLPKVGAGHDQVQQILSFTFATIAALAVLMIVIAGFRYVITQGTPQETAKARNTILYAVIGLIVSLAAEAIVVSVLGKTK